MNLKGIIELLQNHKLRFDFFFLILKRKANECMIIKLTKIISQNKYLHN